MDRENFARFPYQNFDFQRFQGAAGVGPHMSLLRNEEPSSRPIFPEPTSSIADASAAAAQKKKQCKTLSRANNLIDVLGHASVTSNRK